MFKKIFNYFRPVPESIPYINVLLVYKNMSPVRDSCSHVGLGVTAMNLCKNLLNSGIQVEVKSVFDGYELRDKFLPNSEYTHVVMLAPWVDTPFLQGLLRKFPLISFSVVYHSNVGFLQADRYAVKLIREQIELELSNHNFHVACNSLRLTNAIIDTFRRPAVCLPNMYFLEKEPTYPRVIQYGDTLKIGVFGAMRPQKNMLSAVWAGIQMSTMLNAECEISINAGRVEGGESVLGAINELVKDVDKVTLKNIGWVTWPRFREIVKHQHLLISPSYTESFCNVTADGIAEGVPSVVTQAMPWAPKEWKADPDSVESIVRVGFDVMLNNKIRRKGYQKLVDHNIFAIKQWKEYLINTGVHKNKDHDGRDKY